MQRYEKYKDSGVDWIGEIPENWDLRKLKFVCEIYNGDSLNEYQKKLYSSENSNHLAYISSKDIDLFFSTITYENGLRIPANKGFKIAKKNSTLLCIEGGSAGKKIAYTNQDVNFVNKLACFKPLVKSDSKFIFYSLKGVLFRSQFFNSLTGLIGGVSISNIKNFSLTFPPIAEQQAIASFLDDKTSKIDQTISIKEKEIELLKERRQILIQKAVTKGLDNKVRFKDSGVEWIGEIPEHWKVRKLKYCLSSKLKYGANESGVEYNTELPRYIRITDFGFDGNLSEEKKLSLTWRQGRDYLLKDGDILFARSGATVGKSYQFKTSMSFEKNYAFAGYLIKAEANEKIVLSDFLYLYTNSNLFENWKSAVFNKATIENIGADKYSILNVVLPPISEQIEILKDYSKKNEKITKAISLKEQEIKKLKEYKTVLIDNVITGKVKVS